VDQERYAEAEETFAHARDMARSVGLKPLIASALTNLSSVYIAIKKYKKAKETAEEVLSISKGIDDTRSELAAKNNVGYSMVCLGSFDEGIRILEDARRLSIKMGTDHLTLDSMNLLADAYLQSGKRGKAKVYARRALTFAKAKGILNMVRRIEQLMREIDRAG
jgi:tetratricopeptide (TPR) repeat protein